MKPLVSVLTPCYNGEKFIDRYFQAILAQTYTKLELIFVNDGSTDDTERVALCYRQQLEEKGIIFKYVYKENGGQASAMNVGFPYVTGEYLIWPDADDYLSPDSVEKRVDFLESHSDVHWVRSDAVAIDEVTGEKLYRFAKEGDKQTKDIFLDLILEETYCCCGCYMLRMQALREIYPELHIFEGAQGQNWQIQLPMAARYPCGYVHEGLYYYMIRAGSHSHNQTDLEDWLVRYNGLEEILYKMVELSGRTDRDYKKIIDEKAVRTRFRLYVTYNEKEKAKEYYQKLLDMGICTVDHTRRYLKKYHPVHYFFFKIGCIFKRAFAKLTRGVGKREKHND